MGKDAWLTGGLPPSRDLENVSLRLYEIEVRYEAFGAMRMMNYQATSPFPHMISGAPFLESLYRWATCRGIKQGCDAYSYTYLLVLAPPRLKHQGAGICFRYKGEGISICSRSMRSYKSEKVCGVWEDGCR